ncbi:MAG TPA: hypothetical protein VMV75_11080 [Sulfuricella sp.]|nr:hypothetical protein [Sulfuricella sp.]
MAKSKQKRITNAELSAALAEIEAAQRALFSSWEQKKAAKAKLEVKKADAPLALIRSVGEYLDGQRQVC